MFSARKRLLTIGIDSKAPKKQGLCDRPPLFFTGNWRAVAKEPTSESEPYGHGHGSLSSVLVRAMASLRTGEWDLVRKDLSP